MAQVWLWWNPFVWMLNSRIRAERELCRDDLVLSLNIGAGGNYSRLLVDVAERGARLGEATLQAIGLADSFRHTKTRITRALDEKVARRAKMSLATVLLLGLLAAVALPGGTDPKEAPKPSTAVHDPLADFHLNTSDIYPLWKPPTVPILDSWKLVLCAEGTVPDLRAWEKHYLVGEAPRPEGFEGHLPGNIWVMTIKGDGSFEIPDVPPGDYELMLEQAGLVTDTTPEPQNRDILAAPRRVRFSDAGPGEEDKPVDLGEVKVRLYEKRQGATGEAALDRVGQGEPVLQFRLVAETDQVGEAEQVALRVPRPGEGDTLPLLKEILLDEFAVESVGVQRRDQTGSNAVFLDFKKHAAERFGEITGDHIGRKLAIVLDGKILSAPVIRARITGGKAIIEGNFSLDEAARIAETIQAAAGGAPVLR